jgi:hypothetical protein
MTPSHAILAAAPQSDMEITGGVLRAEALKSFVGVYGSSI